MDPLGATPDPDDRPRDASPPAQTPALGPPAAAFDGVRLSRTMLLSVAAALAAVQALLHLIVVAQWASWRAGGPGCIGCFPGGFGLLQVVWVLGAALAGIGAVWTGITVGLRGGVLVGAAAVSLAVSIPVFLSVLLTGEGDARGGPVPFLVPLLLAGAGALLPVLELRLERKRVRAGAGEG